MTLVAVVPATMARDGQESLTAPAELARPEVNLRIESPADLPRMEEIFAHFAGRTDFGLRDILHLLDTTPTGSS